MSSGDERSRPGGKPSASSSVTAAPGTPPTSPGESAHRREAATAPERVEASAAAPAQASPRVSFAAVKAPGLALPQGGGALRSIGESFQANPVTGTLSASIPLPLSEPPHGPTPSLALAYDSGSGNGPFGQGWSVAIPQIVRRTDRGLPRYLDREDSDELLFGGEVLVPVFDGDTRHVDATTSSTHTIERYRPSAEQNHASIERWTNKTTREVHWQVRDASNTLSRFGFTAESRIAVPGHPSRVYAWLLDTVTDDRGHVAEYLYQDENLVGLPVRPSESGRKRGLARIANKHLKELRYGNSTPGDAASYRFQVVFDYGDHHTEAPTPTPSQPWPCRQDPFSSHRAGFDQRCYRLCRRVLVFHRFAELPPNTSSPGPVLVRALELSYAESAQISQLAQARVVGYAWSASLEAYASESSPAVMLSYTTATFERAVRRVPPEQARDFDPQALGTRAQWVDFDGEGIPGVLSDRGRALHYKANRGEGELAPGHVLDSAPNTALASTQLADVAGAGTLAMLRLDPGPPGYHERKGEGWGPFKTFAKAPNIDWASPNTHLIDLDGDGFDDILLTRGDHLLWYPSLGRDGWGSPKRIPLPKDPAEGPSVAFVSRTAAVHLADMSGDGLLDIVRVTFAQVAYWPNLGHGRFGARIVMDRSPRLAREDQFSPGSVRLVDLDGTGAADLVYLDHHGAHLWRNQAGNGFGEEHLLAGVPVVAAGATLSFVDLFGTGMSALTWTPKRRAGEPTVHYATPFGTDKPHLLASITNGTGLETRFEYAASTKFYLADKKARRPWATKLPFPVQVLTRVESYDHIARRRFATTYSYRHGYYDTHEREFRGFGLVETVDAESFDAASGSGLFPDLPIDNGELQQTPVLTKTWFHTGAWIARSSLEEAFAAERYAGDAEAPAPPSSVLPAVPTHSLRDAHRALRGLMLRQEVYGTDDLATPYAVTEQSYEIHLLQPRRPTRAQAEAPAKAPTFPPVFEPRPREVRSATYDRVASDPRLTQWVALAYDETYGFVTQELSVGYARRSAARTAAEAADDVTLTEQSQLLAIATHTTLAHLSALASAHRLGVATESKTYQLTGLSGAALYSVEQLRSHHDEATFLDYVEAPSTGYQLRLVERVRARFYDTGDLPNALPFGDIDARAILYETYQLDLSSDLVTAHLPSATSGMLSEAGYVSFDGGLHQWIPSGRILPDAAHFYLPVSATDPFGNLTTIGYDTTGLFVASVEGPLGSTVVADTDYRTLAPWRLTDPNGNRVEVASDALGRVVAVAVRGKAAESVGDTLADPTETYEYVITAWSSLGTPNYVHHRARKQHGGTPDWQEARTYSDGSGAIAMVKAQAEPGDYPRLDGSGEVELAHSSDRWIASGKTVVNNKGSVVKQYEPFFADGPAYQDEPAIVKWGVTAIVHYDPVGRPLRTDFPDGSYTRTDHAVWRQQAWDQHDTLSDPDNEWRLARESLSGSHPDRQAYEAALVHADTPSRVYLDVLGRPFLSVAHNKTAASSSDAYYETRTQLDIEGQPLSITDALGRTCQTYAHSMTGRPVADSNIDAGARQVLSTVLGEPLYRWDARDQRMRVDYDALRRPTHLWLQVGTDPEVLLERRYYGDDAELTDPEVDNLLGRPVAIYDQAGLVELGPYDFKGNLLEQARTLATVYDATLDWSDLATEPSAEDAKTAALVADLEAETFTEERSYDALNRVVSLIGADQSEHLPTYDRSGKLKELAVKVRGAGTATSFVDDISYDAKGQRLSVEWGNGSTTEYTYDPTTFRLTRLLTTRPSPAATLQDLRYTFDAVGNIARIRDEAQQGVFFGGSFAAPAAVYTYDAVYRLIEASGREHRSIGDVVVDQNDAPLQNLPHANQADAVRNYAERYYYDAVSNILELDHRTPGSPGTIWSRGYTYTSGTNRLASHSAPGGPVSFGHDDHGNMVSMPHLSSVAYTPFDQMRHADLGGGGDAYFTYDASGKRVRKVVDTGANLIKERIYLGSCELYRERVSGSVDLERSTLHIHDGARRVAMVETLLVEDGDPVGSPVDRVRYQLDNHLGSACLELDGAALVISYEEYHPYGTTSYRAGPNGTEVSAKRYRYNGKERDEETGLYDYGARYYAAWLGRWTTADPLGVQAGLNVYLFCRAGPVNYVDPDGREPKPTFTALDQEVGQVVAHAMRVSVLGALLPREDFDALVTGGAKKLGDRGAGLVEFAGAAARLVTPGSIVAAEDTGAAASAYAQDAENVATGLVTAPFAAVGDLAASLVGLGKAALDPSTSVEEVGYHAAGAGLGIADVASLGAGAGAVLGKIKGTFGIGGLADDISAGVAGEFKGMTAADLGVGPSEAGTVAGGRMAGGELVVANPQDLRFTQTDVSGTRFDALSRTMEPGVRSGVGEGWRGPPIDAVESASGLVVLDNTRAAVARHLGIKGIPVAVRRPGEALPPSMAGRFGSATTWGEAAAQRAAKQKPPLGPTGTSSPPRVTGRR